MARRWSPRPVTVLCGPGNNGEACHHADLWPGTVEPMTPALLEGAELVVGTIFGAGLSRAREGGAVETLAAAARKRPPIEDGPDGAS